MESQFKGMNATEQSTIHPGKAQNYFRFLRSGLLAWDRPVAQIAMILQEPVEEEKWASKVRFNRRERKKNSLILGSRAASARH